MIYREKKEKDGHDGFEVFFGKNEKKLVKTCLFQNKYLSLQRSLVVKGHWADIGQASNRLPTLQSLSLNLKLKSLGKGVAVNPLLEYSNIKFRLEFCAQTHDKDMGVRQAKNSGLIWHNWKRCQKNYSQKNSGIKISYCRIPIFFIATPTLYKQSNDISNEKRKLF